MSFGIAVFPCLKTSGSIYLGSFKFRSTEDVDGLAEDQAKAVREVAEMLFLKDDLRITSASYAIIGPINIDHRSDEVDLLSDIRTVVAYGYSSPHDVFDSILLTPEEASLIVLSPSEVSKFLVYPEHHITPLDESLDRRVPADDRGMVQGYAGLYNFTEPFWVAAGSRLYPPRPQATLNIAQNLASDFSGDYRSRSGINELLNLLNRRDHPARPRVFTALKWYNHANESTAGADRALLNLAVAFEALFNLPDNAKSDRLADSISLVLGRPDRIREWAAQFYTARSQVAHEGTASEFYYRPSSAKGSDSEERFGSLMLSGRTIFRLCMATLLFGMSLSEEANLGEKLVSNKERYQKICELLERHKGNHDLGLSLVAPIVHQISTHRYVQSTPIDFDLLLGALRSVGNALISCDKELETGIRKCLEPCAKPKAGKSLYEQLGLVRQLAKVLKESSSTVLSDNEQVLRVLVEEVWHQTFTTYFALDRESSASSPSG